MTKIGWMIMGVTVRWIRPGMQVAVPSADTRVEIVGNSAAGVSFSGNESGKGGALAAGYEGILTVSGNGQVDFTGNIAEYGGAVCTGVYVYLNDENIAGKGSLVMTGNQGVSFSGNSARNNGGAIYNQSNGTVSISSNLGDVSFSGNSAGLYGGAIRGQTFSTIDLSNNAGSVTFSQNKIVRTDVTNVYGGAISVDPNSAVSINGNAGVSISDNSVSTNFNAYGGAISVYNSTLDINGNTRAVSITGNSAKGTMTSSWGSGVEVQGGAVYGKTLNILANTGNVLVSGNVAEAEIKGTAMGGAFYLYDTLSIIGNQEVTFRGNVEKSPTSTVLRSVYVDSESAAGALNLSALAGGSITFYDSLYAAPNSSAYSLTADFNKESGNTGKIVFSGKYTETDLAAYTDGDVEASRTSTIQSLVTLHQGTLSIEDSASLQSAGMDVKNGATLGLNNGTLQMLDSTALTLNTGSSLAIQGSNFISADSITFADGTTLSLTLSSANVETALVTLDARALSFGTLTLDFKNMLGLEDGVYNIMNIGDAEQAGAGWAHEKISFLGLGEKDFIYWNEAGNGLFLSHTVIPEPATSALGLMALAGLAARRRRQR